MARNSLDGLPLDSEGRQKHYEPGDASYAGFADIILSTIVTDAQKGGTLDEAIEECKSNILMDKHPPGYKWHRARFTYLTELIEETMPEEFDGQLLLDSLLDSCPLPTYASGDIEWENPPDFVNPLVQALFTLGYNGLEVNLLGTSFSRKNIGHLLCSVQNIFDKVRDEPEPEPLEVTFVVDTAENIGDYIRNCHMTIIGDAISLGYKAEDSVVRAEGQVLRAARIAKNSTFYLRSARSIDTKPLRGHHSSYVKAMLSNCSFYVKEEVSDMEKLWLKKENFASTNISFKPNSLYERDPKDPDTYREVRVSS